MFSLECPSASGIPGDVGVVGETVRYNLHFRHIGERSAARGTDSPLARYPTGLPNGPLTFHLSSGRVGSMHIVSVLVWGHDRIPIG